MSRKDPTAFTLIETVISLSIMSVLFLGLSGAVMVGSNAIPTATQTGLADQQIIDTLNRFRDELRQASSITYQTSSAGVQYTLTMKASSAPGAPSTIRYRYTIATQSVDRRADSDLTKEYFTGISDFESSAVMDGTRAGAVVMKFVIEDSIQRNFETCITLPNKPEVQ